MMMCLDRKSTRLNSSHTVISYAVFCLKKKTEVAVFASVRSQRERKMAELRRMPCEWHNSSRDDHPSRFPGFPVFQSQLETSSVLLQETNFPAIQVRHGLRLEPASIVREAIERQRSGDLFSTLLLIGLQCQRSRR